jgi:hypothetical protein
MKSLSARVPALIGAALLLGASHSRADQMFSAWNYSWDVAPPVITNGNAGSGGVTFAVSPKGDGTTASPATGGFIIPAGSITTFFSTSTNAVDNFTRGTYTLTLHLTDSTDSNHPQSHDFTWNGTISGTLNGTRDGTNLTNTFSDPLTKTAVVGGHNYSVTLEPNPATINSPGQAATLIDAMVKLADPGTTAPPPAPPPVQEVPEPSTFALAGLALSLAGLGYCYRRRRESALALA